MTTMTANVLSQNFHNYMRVQHDIKHAIRGEKPDLVRELAKELQEPASLLTEYERDYAEWALGLYTRVSVSLIKTHIKEVAKLDRKYKGVQKDFHRKKASWEDLSKVSREFRKYPADTTLMCSLRAAMRGRLHRKDVSFDEQREQVDQIVHHFNKVKEK
jgi:hypothetical protein